MEFKENAGSQENKYIKFPVSSYQLESPFVFMNCPSLVSTPLIVVMRSWKDARKGASMKDFSPLMHCCIWKLWNRKMRDGHVVGDNQGRGESSLNYCGNAHGGYLLPLCDQVSGFGRGFLNDGVTFATSINYLKSRRLGCPDHPWRMCPQWTDDSRVVMLILPIKMGPLCLQATFTMFVTEEMNPHKRHIKNYIFDFYGTSVDIETMSRVPIYVIPWLRSTNPTGYTWGCLAPAL